MKNVLVSIVVPVYNVEKYIKECMDSLINQTLEDIEIICVDNCSDDESVNILQKNYLDDKRVRLIVNDKNMGMPVSRNVGLKKAVGKYVAFVDSDDICDETMFEKLYNMAEKTSADITTCSVYQFWMNVEHKWIHRDLAWYEETEEAVPITKRPQQLLEPAGWCKLYRRDFVNSIDFEFVPGSVSCEDIPCFTEAFLSTNKIAFVHEALYYYRAREDGNLTASMNRKHIDHYNWSMNKQQQIIKKHGLTHQETISYFVEFKYLMAFYILSKIKIKDIKYYFHNITRSFYSNDYKYLHRLFNHKPKFSFLYRIIMGQHVFLYMSYKFARKVYAAIRRFFQKLIRRENEGIYKRLFLFGISVSRYISKKNAKWVNEIQTRKIHHMHGEIQRIATENEDKQKNIDELIMCKTDLEARNEVLTEQNAGIITRNDELIERNSILRVNNEVMESEKNRLTELFMSLETQKGQLQVDIQRLSDEKESISVLLEQTIQMNQNLNVENEQTHAYNAQLRAAVDEKAVYYKNVWCTGFIDKWKDYSGKHFEQMKYKRNVLVAGLDKQSVNIVDMIIERNIDILPRQKYTNLFLYNHERLYRLWELEGAKQHGAENKARSKYKIPSGVKVEDSVFKFHNGLTFLPREALEQISNRDVIDGGAYFGDSALIISGYTPRTIYSFEPSKENYEKLLWTIKENNLQSDVVPINIGLGEEVEQTRMYTYGLDSGASLFDVNPLFEESGKATVETVSITTVDTYVAEHALDIGLIKLDVEGVELEVIKGALKTIERCKPVLLISLYHDPKDFFEIKPLIENMCIGYTFYIRKLVYHDLVTEVMLIGYCEKK